MGDRLIRAVVLSAAALFASGCVISKKPLLGADTRVLPFASGTKFESFSRKQERDPWTRDTRSPTYTANAALEVREGDHKFPVLTFHPVDLGKYIIQGQFENGYAYAFLVVRNGEGFVSQLECDKIDANLFKTGGGVIESNGTECSLDRAPHPLQLLRQIGERAPVNGRFVPSR